VIYRARFCSQSYAITSVALVCDPLTFDRVRLPSNRNDINTVPDKPDGRNEEIYWYRRTKLRVPDGENGAGLIDDYI
jgi:hypothetical protein